VGPYVVAAGLAGVLLALDFDPIDLPYSSIVGVAALFVIAHRLDPVRRRDVALLGLAFGLGFMAPLIWWMHAVSYGAYVALVLAQAVFFVPILFGLRLVSRLWWWPVAMPAVWVLGESARSVVPFSGFPWGRLAHTAVDTPLDGYVRWVGMPATSFIVCLLAAGLAWLVVRSREQVMTVVGGAAAVLVVGAVLPVGLAGGHDDRGGSAQIALVQGNVPGDFFTWKRGEIFKLHAAETVRLSRRVTSGELAKPDLVLWPENSTDVDPFHDESLAAQIERLSDNVDAPILVGGLFDGPTVNTAYNAGVVWTGGGPQGRYVKRKVVPYGEYVPFRQVLGPIVPKFDRFIPRDMLPGDQPNVLSAGRVQLGDTICWDIAFDGLIREAVGGGAQVLVVQTSNASFTGTAQPEQQFKISRLRAIETGRWVMVPSTNGISGIIDATGHVVARAPMHAPATLSASVPLADGSTLGVVAGRWLNYALMLGGAAAIGWAWRRT
jgi:apolipoprotein N-acyltransferase